MATVIRSNFCNVYNYSLPHGHFNNSTISQKIFYVLLSDLVNIGKIKSLRCERADGKIKVVLSFDAT